MTVRNPIEWGSDQLRLANLAAGSASRAVRPEHERSAAAAVPVVRRIEIADLGDVLAKGLEDFGAYRTDVIFLCVIYPVVGLILGRLAFGYGMLPLLFPLASGFALVGPFAAIGLYEMSRRREQGVTVAWPDAFAVLGSPAFGRILVLGLMLVVIDLIWLGTAAGIYAVTLGPQPPASLNAFVHGVFATGAGWALIVVGIGGVAGAGIPGAGIAEVGVAAGSVLRRGFRFLLPGRLGASLRTALELLEAELIVFLLLSDLFLHLQDLEIHLLDLAVQLAQLVFQTRHATAVVLRDLRLFRLLLVAEDAERRQVEGEPTVGGSRGAVGGGGKAREA